MKTSFSVKVTGSITVSIEPSNGGDAAAADTNGDNGVNFAVDVLLASFMKTLVEDAIRKYVHKGALVGDKDGGDDGEEEDEATLPSNYYSSTLNSFLLEES
jgi:hypothetical protein